MGQQPGPQFSPDRKWWWDGVAWQPAISPDGRWRWNGYTWVGAGGLSSAWIALIAAVVIGIVVLAIPLALIGFSRIEPRSAASPQASSSPRQVTSIPCDQLEHTQVHYHAYLQILNRGEPVSIPTEVGRKLGCFYWLHMHTNEAGMIHVEAPADRTFTLGDFFDVWSDWGGQAQPLDSGHVASVTLAGSQKLAAWIDLGDGPVAYSGDPRGIVLRSHEIITLEVTPPAVNPPPSFTWPSGF